MTNPASNSEDAPNGANSPEPVAPSQRLIKRYSNRKLYDKARSKYVTLDDIAQMVKAGEDVRIIDNDSQEDLTSVTLTQIIFEEEKANRRVPLKMLREIIIHLGGGTLNDWWDGFFSGAQRSVGSSVNDLRHGALSIKGAAAKLGDSARRLLSSEARQTEEFRRNTSVALDQLELRIDERILHIRQGVAKADEEEPLVEPLRTRLAALSVKVDRLEMAHPGQEDLD